jgi:hypothetical protein
MKPHAARLLLTAALALTACGRTTVPPTQAVEPGASSAAVPIAVAAVRVASPQAEHPCRLLSNADAEAVIGHLLDAAPVDDSMGGAHTCTWQSGGGHLTLYTATSEEAVVLLQSQFGAAGGSPNVPVPGVGESAGWLQAGGYMLVQKGGTTFAIGIAGPGATLDAAKTLALKVIAGL